MSTKAEGEILMKIPENVQCVIDAIHVHGNRCWLVGGAVRDSLLGKQPRDYDLLTDMSLEQLKGVFSKVVVKGGLRQESAIVIFHGYPVDIVCLDDRDLYAEMARRDFTINSLAIDLTDGKLLDYFNGQNDLQRGILSCGTQIEEKINTDPIRIMRAVRFVCELDLAVDEKTNKVLKKNMHLLPLAAPERIRDEFVRMLMGTQLIKALRMMQHLGILAEVFPEIDAMCGCLQSPPHRGDVFEHTMSALEYAKADLELRLAVLLHDIGKPPTMSIEKGAYRFYGHHEVGAQMAVAMLRRLRFPGSIIRNVATLIENHMFTYHSDTASKDLSRLYRDIGGHLIGKLVDVRICDWRSIFPEGDPALFEQWRVRMCQIAKCFEAGTMQPAINGNDIMRIAGVPPGAEVGVILEKVLAAIEESPTMNQKDKLEEFVRSITT